MTLSLSHGDTVWVDGVNGEYLAIFIAWDGTSIHANGSEHRIARVYREGRGYEYTVEEWEMRQPHPVTQRIRFE